MVHIPTDKFWSGELKLEQAKENTSLPTNHPKLKNEQTNHFLKNNFMAGLPLPQDQSQTKYICETLMSVNMAEFLKSTGLKVLTI